MGSASVLLCTEKRDYFAYQDGYEGVTTLELKTLLERGQETVRSLEAELEARQVSPKLESSNAVAECIEKLRKSMGNLEILGRLDERATKLVTSAVNLLRAEQSNRQDKLYQTFLHDIHSQCGREQVVLCAASLGKQRIICLNAQDRTNLVQNIKINKAAFASPVLKTLVERYKLPDRNELFSANLQVSDRSAQKRPISDVIGDDRPEGNNVNKAVTDDRAQQAMGVADRRIEYRYSEAPIALIHDLGETLTLPMQTSSQWKWERELGGSTTDCLNVLSPKNRSQDISITLLVGFEAGMQLVRDFQLLPR